jgi:cytidylate kinase
LGRVYWLTGKTCVGKSRWSKEQAGKVQVISTGELCRRVVGEHKMALDDNPVTPAETEPIVRSMVERAIQDLEPTQDLIVDSAPRSPEQVDWIEQLRGRFSVDHVIRYCFCGDEERQRRIHLRCEASALDEKLIRRRLEVEDAVFLGVIERLLVSSLPVQMFDMQTHSVRETRPLDSDFDLQRMFEEHEALNDEALRKFGVTTAQMRERAQVDHMDPMDESCQWLNRFLVQGKHELSEALACLPEKWWTTDKADLRAVRVELIDAWHFIMSAAMCSGMTAREFSKIYYEKRAINLARWRSGNYSSKNKDHSRPDDGHLGKIA